MNPKTTSTISNRVNMGTNQSGMRAYNERLVLTLIRRHGALPKSDIARMTGLSAQTASVIMRNLEKDGLLKRGEPTRIQGKVGQPSVPMSLVANGALFFGLKIGRRRSDLVLIDFLGNIVDISHLSYGYPTPASIVQFVKSSIDAMSSRLSKKQLSRISGMGIGMPFQLWNWPELIGTTQITMDSWRVVDIHRLIADHCDFPVYMENDVSAACAAELVFGQSQLPQSFLYFHIGYFIGGGIVLNGSLFTGPGGNAGALGSMPVPVEGCETRQLIDLASVATLEKAIDETGEDSSTLWDNDKQWDLESAAVKKWIQQAANGIAHAIVSSVSVIDFEACVIDGSLPANIRSELVNLIRQHLQDKLLPGLKIPEIYQGSIGANARVLGAASLPLSERFLVDQNTFLQQ
jgi:predicted NBD/HSP70 family sugar kinase